MDRLTFPIKPAGLVVDVRVNLDAGTLNALRAASQPIPVSISTTGLIDTGTDISAVAPSVLQQLGVPVYGYGRTQAVGGSVPVRLFKVTVFVLDEMQPHLPWLDRGDLVVMELPVALPVDVLIGMDILLGCRLLVDGPAKQFMLEY
jgi:hypothetical protein